MFSCFSGSATAQPIQAEQVGSSKLGVAAPDLAITKMHSGNFAQGQAGANYTINVTNTGSAAITGTTTVVDTLPAGLTATSITGAGWSCNLGTLTCTRADALVAGIPYPVITLTVNVSCTAAAVLTNSVMVTNPSVTVDADDTAMDVTTITATLGCGAPPDLTVKKSHDIFFALGQISYTISVTNVGGSPTTGTVTVVDTLPASLTATSITATGWACVLATLTCTRADALPVGASYPPIMLTVTVGPRASGVVTNSVTVSGGAETNLANDTASDATTLDAFQVRYASNLNIGDSVVNVTNTGAGSMATGRLGFAGGNLCVNAYVFDQSEEMLACCACFVTPNGLASFSVKGQLISNSLTPEIPNSVVIKLVASAGGAGGCDAANVTLTNLAPGMRAFGTTLHALPATPLKYGVTETPFSVSTLSQAELNHLTGFCAFIESNGSGFGICRGCSVGGLGATTLP